MHECILRSAGAPGDAIIEFRQQLMSANPQTFFGKVRVMTTYRGYSHRSMLKAFEAFSPGERKDDDDPHGGPW